jgi:hypothetical protein
MIRTLIAIIRTLTAIIGACQCGRSVGGSIPSCRPRQPERPQQRRACAAPPATIPAPGLPLGPPLPHLLQNWAHPCHICTGAGLTPGKHLRLSHLAELGAPGPLPHLHRSPDAVRFTCMLRPNRLSRPRAACQKGPTEGREQPAAGFGLRVLISMGLGALGAVGPLGSASGAQQATGQPAPASTHARHWRCRRGRFALRLPHWQRPWRRAVLNAALRDNGHGTLDPSRGPGRLASSSLQVQQPTSPGGP